MAKDWGRREFLGGVAGLAGSAGVTRWHDLWTPSTGAPDRPVPTAPRPGAEAVRYRRILVPHGSHPATAAAARLIAQRMGLSEDSIQPCDSTTVPEAGDILLVVAPAAPPQLRLLGEEAHRIQPDGYLIAFSKGGALICGSRPRALLFAAGDTTLWRTRVDGTLLRAPAFAIRAAGFQSKSGQLPRGVAELGINIYVGGSGGGGGVVTLKNAFPKIYDRLSGDEQQRMEEAQSRWAEHNRAVAQECHDADVDFYPFLYGNNFEGWSRPLYQAVIEAYPEVQGVSAPRSWEKGTLCPSQPMTWEIVNAYVREFMEMTGGDGLSTTFWDHYGMYCQNDACVRNGLNQFRNEVYVNVKNYYDTLKPMGKRLLVRTWASGCPHWLRDQFVHAPGYGHFGGSGEDVWGRVIKELPNDLIIQTKVYNSDCEPDPPFSPLIGKAAPHPEVAEYQIVGQTTGRFYFPASCVNYNTRTMRKSHALIGARAGISVSAGATKQTNFSLFDDILNSVNLHAWRQVTWNLDADLDQIWSEWAVPIYGEKAAPHMIRALQLSESAVNHTFSILGFGSDTNSDFPGTIERTETLLRYTNRYYLPEYARYLVPNRENIERVIEQKQLCLKQIDEMFDELGLARPHLRPEQAQEIQTRFTWLKEFAICRAHLDESLWRFRHVRYLASLLTTDPEQMKPLAAAWDAVHEHAQQLFQYTPDEKLSCYDTTLGNLPHRPTLGNPLPLMNELYTQSRQYVEQFIGPGRLPKEWLRGSEA